MIEIEPFAQGMIQGAMKEAGLDIDKHALYFGVTKDNKFIFNFTEDIFYAKRVGAVLVVDDMGDFNVMVEAVSNGKGTGLIIKEKL